MPVTFVNRVVGDGARHDLRAGVLSMGYAPSIATKTISAKSSPSSRRSRTNILATVFAAILATLHHSRRLQAQRTLRQYRHLIDNAGPGIAPVSNATSRYQHVGE
jgi:hypothetical protein